MMKSTSTSTSTVQCAIDFFDTVTTPLVQAMEELDSLFQGKPIISYDGYHDCTHKETEFRSDRHSMSLYTRTRLVPEVCIMKLFKMPQMLFSYNSVRPYRCEMSTTSIASHMGFGVMNGIDSTVTLEGGKIPRVSVVGGEYKVTVISQKVKDIFDIRNRPHELDFELLLDMDDEFIFPFILSSMWSQTFPKLEGNFYCSPEHLHTPELALKHLNHMIKKEKKNGCE